MKLQILIPHCHEEAEVVKPLLDSIALQQQVDFSEIGVIICHDGEDISNFEIATCYVDSHDAELPIYPFKIEQIHIPHAGVSAARNACLDHAVADYVCFCDCDDIFHNACGLWILFKEMDRGFDSLLSVFVEETRCPQDIPENKQTGQPAMKKGEVMYINHELDSTFVHGKVHRRGYLLEQNIRFNDKLTIHEDSYFNILCQNLSTDVRYCVTPFYLWRWRDASVCRHDPKYMLKTYRNMLDSNDALVDEFVRRGRQDKAFTYCGFMVFDAYYTMNKPEWINQENKEYRDITEKRFSAYYAKHKKLWNSIPTQDKMQISNGVRTRIVNEGMLMEAITIEDWLRRMEANAE